MSNDQHRNNPDSAEFYRQKDARRISEAQRPVSEKIAAVVRLRDLEQSLANTRKMNKAQRAAKQIKLKIKTR
jgi:hypothetical protein